MYVYCVCVCYMFGGKIDIKHVNSISSTSLSCNMVDALMQMYAFAWTGHTEFPPTNPKIYTIFAHVFVSENQTKVHTHEIDV